ncbi:MAG: site-2 protease family protein [Candidatus Promineifilaceae bacterium]
MTVAPAESPVSLDSVQGLRSAIADLFQVSDTTLDAPESGYVRFRGTFLQDPSDCFDELRQRFERYGFTPLAQPQGERVVLIGIPAVFQPAPSNPWINLALFVATIFSTLYVGAAYANTGGEFSLWSGWPFSLSILLILGAHEMGHYIAARYHKVPVTLPYFIPLPITFIGTMGAVIRIKGPVQNKRELLDVGAAGPWAGMLFAVPLLFYGLVTSVVAALPLEPYLIEGNSLLYALMKLIVFGRFLPANGFDVHLNQIAWAGWAGLLVTSINLIPLGQLDGGHVASVLFGEKARLLYWPIIIGLVGIMFISRSPTWLVLVALLFFLGRSYNEPLDQVTELDFKRKVIAVMTLALFFLLFIPVPLQFVTP